MKLTILGCSGSLAAPGNPGSSYVVSTDGNSDILLDFGPGALAAMQEHFDPADAHVCFSHLHADHCSDIASLLVWRRYHPTKPAAGRHRMLGPSYTPQHVGKLSSDGPEDVDDISDTFDFSPLCAGQPETLGEVTITPFDVLHPAAESHALRIEHAGRVLTYSGDSAFTPALIDAARDADLFLCEAAWGAATEDTPPGMHMSGQEAGRIAREAGVATLVIVHIQPWTSTQETLEAAREEFDGEIVIGSAGDVFEL